MTQAWIPNPVRREVSISAAGTCHHCGLTASTVKVDRWSIPRFYDSDGIPYELDHLIPRSEGGATTVENVVLSCRTCNRSRKRVTRVHQEALDSLVEAIGRSGS